MINTKYIVISRFLPAMAAVSRESIAPSNVHRFDGAADANSLKSQKAARRGCCVALPATRLQWTLRKRQSQCRQSYTVDTLTNRCVVSIVLALMLLFRLNNKVKNMRSTPSTDMHTDFEYYSKLKCQHLCYIKMSIPTAVSIYLGFLKNRPRKCVRQLLRLTKPGNAGLRR